MEITKKQSDEFGFDIRDGRAMVSLGPKSKKRFCTYNCAFCYVHAEFASYPSMSPNEIRSGLEHRLDEFDIVYVSGDTDSLAPGRTEEGLELIEALSTLGVDVLFTTRAPLSNTDLDRLQRVNQKLKESSNLLFGCISISRLHTAPHLEPKPVPSPSKRLDVLRGLKERGIIAVLAMRPFLPVIPADEYVQLAKLATPFSDVMLGEVWYADRGGLLESQVFQDPDTKIENYQSHQMDFDDNGQFWKVWQGDEVRDAVSAYCESADIPFFMRSRPAIMHIRQMRENTV